MRPVAPQLSPERRVIGYYVHHHGSGHLMRARAITAHLDENVTYLSSLPQPWPLRSGDRWVQLAEDVDEHTSSAVDVTAHGRLHWAPLNTPGVTLRCRQILGAICDAAPRRVVVDVSVEATLLARLAGCPVTVMAMPGQRDDAAHRLAYDIADQIVAPWSASFYAPAWLDGRRDRVHFVGAISRFDGVRPRSARSVRRGVLLAGSGGDQFPADALAQLAAVAPELTWHAVGGAAGWMDDAWPLLEGAEVVVAHAGQGALADVSLTGAAAVVLPQDRPFDEQCATADALARNAIAVTATGWPTADQWPSLIARAKALPPHRWTMLNTSGAAKRAAQVIAR